jgi:hypothetical protein
MFFRINRDVELKPIMTENVIKISENVDIKAEV